MGSPVRVAVVSAIRFYREGLGQLLSAAEDICVCATLPIGLESIDTLVRERPDIILVDVSTPEALAALRAIGEQAADVRTIAVAVSGNTTDILECARAAAAGYVSRDASLCELIATIHSVNAGELRYPPAAAAVIRRRLADASEAPAPPTDHGLTAREVEILHLLSQNLGNKAIAQKLNIEVSTVKSHVHHILEKLRVTRRLDAVATLHREHRSLTPP